MLFFFLMEGSICSLKLKYDEYLEKICRYLLDDIYTNMTRVKILYGEIACIYIKAHVMVM